MCRRGRSALLAAGQWLPHLRPATSQAPREHGGTRAFKGLPPQGSSSPLLLDGRAIFCGDSGNLVGQGVTEAAGGGRCGRGTSPPGRRPGRRRALHAQQARAERGSARAGG